MVRAFNPRETRILNPRAALIAQEERTDRLGERPLTNDQVILRRHFVGRMKENRPNIEDFSDIYPPEKIQEDQERLRNSQETHNDPISERGKILEALVLDRIEKDNWFGESTYTVLAAEYDDRINGVDLVIEFVVDGKVERLAIDVTTAQDEEVIEKKWRSIVDPLMRKGHLTKLKYFESEADRDIVEKESNITKGEVSMPKIILGIDTENFDDLAKEIASKLERGERVDLSEHFLKYDFLDLAHQQLTFLLEIAGRKAPAFKKEGIKDKLQTLVREIEKEKSKRPPQTARIGSRNDVYGIVTNHLKRERGERAIAA